MMTLQELIESLSAPETMPEFNRAIAEQQVKLKDAKAGGILNFIKDTNVSGGREMRQDGIQARIDSMLADRDAKMTAMQEAPRIPKNRGSRPAPLKKVGNQKAGQIDAAEVLRLAGESGATPMFMVGPNDTVKNTKGSLSKVNFKPSKASWDVRSDQWNAGRNAEMEMERRKIAALALSDIFKGNYGMPTPGSDMIAKLLGYEAEMPHIPAEMLQQLSRGNAEDEDSSYGRSLGGLGGGILGAIYGGLPGAIGGGLPGAIGGGLAGTMGGSALDHFINRK